jgi:ABC-type nitrate/sulfonate/bicarbonate transport system substrate-binding protein
MKLKCRSRELVVAGALIFASLAIIKTLPAQPLDKMRLGYSGTGINNYVLEMGKRQGIFRRNGIDLEVV